MKTRGFRPCAAPKSDFPGSRPHAARSMAANWSGPMNGLWSRVNKELRREDGLNIRSGRNLKSDGSGICAVELTKSAALGVTAQRLSQ